jgi:putative transposase
MKKRYTEPFYNWKKRYSGLTDMELRELKQLQEDNRQLKKLVADLSLDKLKCLGIALHFG